MWALNLKEYQSRIIRSDKMEKFKGELLRNINNNWKAIVWNASHTNYVLK